MTCHGGVNGLGGGGGVVCPASDKKKRTNEQQPKQLFILLLRPWVSMTCHGGVNGLGGGGGVVCPASDKKKRTNEQRPKQLFILLLRPINAENKQKRDGGHQKSLPVFRIRTILFNNFNSTVQYSTTPCQEVGLDVDRSFERESVVEHRNATNNENRRNSISFFRGNSAPNHV